LISNVLTRTQAQDTRRFPAAILRAFLVDALRACGLSEADASTVAKAMLEADLTGSDAHGIFRLAGYVRQLKRGAINPRASIRVLERGPATALIDGDHGMGHVVMTYAAHLAVELARRLLAGYEPSAEQVLRLCEETLGQLYPERENLEILLSPRDAGLLDQVSSDWKTRHPGLRITIDATLGSGDCQVRSRFGLTDARRQSKLEALSRELLSV